MIPGFSSVFELAMDGNPSVVVELAKVAEMYEQAAETF
jgi:hypothetical protein